MSQCANGLWHVRAAFSYLSSHQSLCQRNWVPPRQAKHHVIQTLLWHYYTRGGTTIGFGPEVTSRRCEVRPRALLSFKVLCVLSLESVQPFEIGSSMTTGEKGQLGSKSAIDLGLQLLVLHTFSLLITLVVSSWANEVGDKLKGAYNCMPATV